MACGCGGGGGTVPPERRLAPPMIARAPAPLSKRPPLVQTPDPNDLTYGFPRPKEA